MPSKEEQARRWIEICSTNYLITLTSEHGGHCDCEVLYNVEEQFED